MPGHVYAPNVDLGPEDLEAVEEVSRGYWQAWYTGDVELMGRCLHPELDKRALVRRVLDKRAELIDSDLTTRSGMLGLTEAAVGQTDNEDRNIEITVLAALHHLASVRASGNGMTDLLHLMKFPEGWRIVHSIWTLDGGTIATATYDT